MKEKAMKWKPYFSHLLQSKAALLQVISPQECIQPPPLFEPHIFTAPLSSIHKLPLPRLPADLFRAPAKASPHEHAPIPPLLRKAASSVKVPVENQSGEQEGAGAPAQIDTSNPSLQESVIPARLQITAAPDAASSKANPYNPPPTTPFTLPLIRSKTGRIILPSSLKPSKLYLLRRLHSN